MFRYSRATTSTSSTYCPVCRARTTWAGEALAGLAARGACTYAQLCCPAHVGPWRECLRAKAKLAHLSTQGYIRHAQMTARLAEYAGAHAGEPPPPPARPNACQCGCGTLLQQGLYVKGHNHKGRARAYHAQAGGSRSAREQARLVRRGAKRRGQGMQVHDIIAGVLSGA